MRISIIFNNTQWATESDKIKDIQKFFSPLGDFEYPVLHTSFTNIPLMNVGAIGGITNTLATTTTVDYGWYTTNVTPLAKDSDIIVFVLAPQDLPAGRTSIGIMQGQFLGVYQACIFAIPETDHAYINGMDFGSSFSLFCEHEISHALYLKLGRTDNTHKYFYSGNPTKVIDELKDNKLSLRQQLLNALKTLAGLYAQQKMIHTTNLYDIALPFKGQHLTLDESIPKELGCAECMSYILSKSGFSVGDKGLAGTSVLYDWLLKNFTPVTTPQKGDIVISVTGTGRVGSRGHVGIYDGMSRVLSNDSNSGLLEDYWTLKGWIAHYETDLQMPTHYFTQK